MLESWKHQRWDGRDVSVRLSFAACLIATTVAFGCSESHGCGPGRSGVDSCEEIADLTDDQLAAYCDWEFALHMDPGTRRCTEGEYDYGVPLQSADRCVARLSYLRGLSCARTIEQEESCWSAVVADTCNWHREPACTEMECVADAGAAGGDAGM